jgi:hypothetical protein
LRRLCEPCLEPGEEVRHLFSGWVTASLDRLVVAVTDRSILVVEVYLSPRGWQPNRIRSCVRLPRATRIGPRYGAHWYVVDGKRIVVSVKSHRSAIAAADAEMDFPPPDAA